MAEWRDEALWAGLRSGSACPICLLGAPHDIVFELDVSWVTMHERAPMRGYTCLVFRRHAVELHELSVAEGAAFMRDLQRLSRAVANVTEAIKLNYEIHGNTLPHLHVHLYPRYVGDPFEGKPIDLQRHSHQVYPPAEFSRLRQLLITELATND